MRPRSRRSGALILPPVVAVQLMCCGEIASRPPWNASERVIVFGDGGSPQSILGFDQQYLFR